MNDLYLRKAEWADINFLYQLANEEEVRKNSFNSEPINLEEHTKWFQNKLDSKQCDLFLYCCGEIPIGQVRLDYENEYAYIDYSIVPDYRGNGYGYLMLMLLEETLVNRRQTKKILVGNVKKDNLASVSVFKRLHYCLCEKDSYFEFTKSIDKV